METLKSITEKFEKIGYSIKGKDPNRFIFNNIGENTNFRVWDDSIEYKITLENSFLHSISINYYFDRIRVDVLDGGDAISICSKNDSDNTGLFTNFYQVTKK